MRGGFAGAPRWLDGEHWLAVQEGRLMKVHAATGRSQPFVDAKALAKGLSRLELARREHRRNPIAGRTSFDMDPAKRGFLFEHGQDLYYATFDGSTAVRLTNHPGREQFPQFSPDGKSVAFVRDFDLYVVDIAAPTERRLTTGGRDDLRHGHADWVYYEEIFNRRWPAFWWSPDSKKLAFMEFDDAGVPLHTVMDDTATPRRLEQTHYPRSGEPNPKVRFGVVASAGGPVQWADLADYSADSFLISDVGWWPDSSAAYCYVQNRIQTWLDFVKFTPGEEQGLGQAAVPRLRPRPGSRARGRCTGSTTARSSGSPSATAGSIFIITTPRGNQKAQLTSGPVGSPRTRARRLQERLDLLHRHARQPGGDEPLSHQARRPGRAADASRRQPHSQHEPGRPALPVELVRHQDADAPAALRSRRPAGPDGRLQPVARAQAAAGSARASGCKSRPRTVSCSRPS